MGATKIITVLSISIAIAACILYVPNDKLVQVARSVLDFFPESIKSRLFKIIPLDSNVEIVLSKKELKRMRGEGGGEIYLAILGQVFDVTAGKQHYGPAGSYHFFTGVDGTRSFITGDFTENGLSDKIDDFDLQQVRGIAEWTEFYQTQYKYIGKVVGNFYDKKGNPTKALEEFQKKLKSARIQQDLDQKDFTKFPPCNSENKPGVFRRLWCSNQSGGIKRDWAGLPREYFRPGQREPRCACVRNKGPPTDHDGKTKHRNRGDLDNPMFKVYDGCKPSADSCTFKD